MPVVKHNLVCHSGNREGGGGGLGWDSHRWNERLII